MTSNEMKPTMTSPDTAALLSSQDNAGARATLELSEEAEIAAIRRGDTNVGRRLHSRLIRVIDSTLTRIVGRISRTTTTGCK